MRWPAGMRVPGVASGTTSPTFQLVAPHTTCTAPGPASTWQTASFSAPGWRSDERMRAATTPSRAAPTRSTPSTSSPTSVRRRASSSAGGSGT